MEENKSIIWPVFVLFEIAKRWPPIHLAFLANKHYRAQYNDKGARNQILRAEGDQWFKTKEKTVPYSRIHCTEIHWGYNTKPHSFFPTRIRRVEYENGEHEVIRAEWDQIDINGDRVVRCLFIECAGHFVSMHEYTGENPHFWFPPVVENKEEKQKALKHLRGLKQLVQHVRDSIQ